MMAARLFRWLLPALAPDDLDTFEMDRRMPSHQQRLAAEKKTNVYFLPGKNASGAAGYVYVVSSAILHEDFIATIQLGVIPPYAVVVERGMGEPDENVKKKMLDYYGFDHDTALS